MLGVTSRFGAVWCTGAVVQRDRALNKIGPQHVGHPVFKRHFQRFARVTGPGAPAPLLDQAALMPDRKTHIRSRQRRAPHRLDAVGQFGRVGLEKLAPRRCAVEQLLHLHRRPAAARHRAQFAGPSVQRKRTRGTERA